MRLRGCLFVFGLLLAGCATRDLGYEAYQKYSAKQLLALGKHEMEGRHYTAAVKYLEVLEVIYPFEEETRQGQLSLMQAYYLNKNYDEAIIMADRYLRLYMDDPQIDYIYYMKGLANLKNHRSFGQRIFRVDLSLVDLESFKKAYQCFEILVQTYPNSQYLQEAQNQMRSIRELLADRELKVAQFYFDRQAYVAAVNRIEGLVKEYPSSPQATIGIKLMVQAYDRLGLQEQAEAARKLLNKKSGAEVSR